MERNQFTRVDQVKEYMYAGKATITAESEVTGKHLTYKITAIENSSHRFWVKLLGGQDNENSYYYIGMIDDGAFKLTKASRVTDETTSVKALHYILAALNKDKMPTSTKIWHEGKCGRCGRKLTVPESIERGIGPECATIMGLHLPKEIPHKDFGPSEYRQAIGGPDND